MIGNPMRPQLVAWPLLDGPAPPTRTPECREVARMVAPLAEALLQLRADGCRASIAAVSALALQRPVIERALRALGRGRPATILLDPLQGGAPFFSAMAWRVHLARTLAPLVAVLEAEVSESLLLRGMALSPASVPSLACERALAALHLQTAARDWVIEAMPRPAAALLPNLHDVHVERGPAGDGPGARSRQLAIHWLDAHLDGQELPLPLRVALPRLQPALTRLGERDTLFWHCPVHPGRRLLNDWLASMCIAFRRQRFEITAVESEIDGMIELLSTMPDGADRPLRHIPPARERARVARDASLFPAWSRLESERESARIYAIA